MPTTRASKKKAAPSGKAASAAASIGSGALPPYGIAIRDAVSRGDVREMRGLAAASRKYLKEVQSALVKLDAAIGGKR